MCAGRQGLQGTCKKRLETRRSLIRLPEVCNVRQLYRGLVECALNGVLCTPACVLLSAPSDHGIIEAMRLFLALTPDARAALAIDHWRALHWPAQGREVPIQNLHVTLCFLGEVDERRAERLVLALDEFVERPRRLEVDFDEPGYHPASAVTLLTPSAPPDALMTLGKRMRSLANRAGIRVDKRPFKPHVTLARRVDNPPPPPLSAPDICLQFDRIDLVESIRERAGVRYRECASWSS